MRNANRSNFVRPSNAGERSTVHAFWRAAAILLITLFASLRSHAQSCPPGAWVTTGLPPAPNAVVRAITTLTNGDMIVGGSFTSLGGVDGQDVSYFYHRWENGC